MMGIVRGLSTLVLLGTFLGMVVWAYGRARRGEFEAMARLALEEGNAPPSGASMDIDGTGAPRAHASGEQT